METSPSISPLQEPYTAVDDDILLSDPPPAARSSSPIDVDALPDSTVTNMLGIRGHKPKPRKPPCSGFTVRMPPGVSAHGTYPFALHDELGDPWNYSVMDGILVLSARGCQKVSMEGKDQCRSCETLADNRTLQGIIERMERGVKENSHLVYHGIGGLVKIVRQKTGQVQALRLRKLNDARKLIGKAAALEDHKEWMMAIGSGKVERIDRLVRAGIASKRGVRGMLEMHNRAAQRVYRTQNYTEEDALRGLLFWRLGGARVAEIAHRALSLPSLSTLRRRTIVPPIVASPGQPTRPEIEKNVSACFESIKDVVGGNNVVHQVLMLDELKVEERPCWDDKTNMILGVCREHGKNASLDFNSKHEAELLIQSIQAGDTHLAVEVRFGVGLGVVQ